MSPKDCYGSPPPETQERMHTQQGARAGQNNNNNEPQMRSFAAVTPSSSAGGSGARVNVRNTSARATRGRSTTQSRRTSTTNNHSQAPQPRQLLPPKQEQAPPLLDTESGSISPPEPLLLNLPRSLLPHWCALMMCSALCLAAVAAGTPLTMSSSTAVTEESSHYEDMQMAMAISTLSLMLTFVAGACYLLIPASFVGTLYEVTVVRTCYHEITERGTFL